MNANENLETFNKSRKTIKYFLPNLFFLWENNFSICLMSSIIDPDGRTRVALPYHRNHYPIIKGYDEGWHKLSSTQTSVNKTSKLPSAFSLSNHNTFRTRNIFPFVPSSLSGRAFMKLLHVFGERKCRMERRRKLHFNFQHARCRSPLLPPLFPNSSKLLLFLYVNENKMENLNNFFSLSDSSSFLSEFCTCT